MQKNAWLLYGGIAAVVLLDAVTKMIATVSFAEPVWLTSFLALALSYNTNLAFGIPLSVGATIVLSVAAIGFLVWLYRTRARCDCRLTIFVFALILGGAIGNLAERAVAGRVTDFIAFPVFPSFNLADSAITVGATILILGHKKILYS